MAGKGLKNKYRINYSKHNSRLITVVPAFMPQGNNKAIRRALLDTMKFYQLHYKFDNETYGYKVNLGLLNLKTLTQQFDSRCARCAPERLHKLS